MLLRFAAIRAERAGSDVVLVIQVYIGYVCPAVTTQLKFRSKSSFWDIITGLKDFFLGNDDAIDAMMHYFKLVEWCVEPESRKKKDTSDIGVAQKDSEPEAISDWNQVMKDFYEPVAETASGIIFIWPDVLPMQYRKMIITFIKLPHILTYLKSAGFFSW